MSAAAALLIAIMFCFLARMLCITSVPVKPNVICGNGKFMENLMKYCACLSEIYRPPGLWGKSGHLQTIIHGLFGRTKVPHVCGERWTCTMADGATATFDIYVSKTKHSNEDHNIFLVCPGIANSSESVYIQWFVAYALEHGYTCAVQNHLGSVRDVPLTSPRVFTYGATDEFHQLANYMSNRFPKSKMIAVGFSMGGNIVTKYLGEKKEKPKSLIAGISICQGYDAVRSQPMLMKWENLRRLYFIIVTETVKDVIRRYREMLLCDSSLEIYKLEERKIFQSQTLIELDEYFTRRVSGFNTLPEFLQNQSSSTYMKEVELPMLFINAEDDPLVPIELLDNPKAVAENPDKESALITTTHGGHLGFFEGGIVFPSKITWLDRIIVQFGDMMTKTLT
ncbi:hypothetical protein CHUAL_010995 [Chamberlinius hualienensis]